MTSNRESEGVCITCGLEDLNPGEDSFGGELVCWGNFWFGWGNFLDKII
jgi:hypothetical protein